MNTCCFCNRVLDKMNMHNPAPLADESYDCCRECNNDFVVPVRSALLKGEFSEASFEAVKPQIVALIKTACSRVDTSEPQGTPDVSACLHHLDTRILPYVKGYLCSQGKTFADSSIMIRRGVGSDSLLIHYYCLEHKDIMAIEVPIQDIRMASPCF